MTVVVETIVNSKNNRVSVHCGECWKVIAKEEEGLEPWDVDSAVNLMMATAYRHTQKHPKHNPKVFIYQRVPSNAELRGD